MQLSGKQAGNTATPDKHNRNHTRAHWSTLTFPQYNPSFPQGASRPRLTSDPVGLHGRHSDRNVAHITDSEPSRSDDEAHAEAALDAHINHPGNSKPLSAFSGDFSTPKGKRKHRESRTHRALKKLL